MQYLTKSFLVSKSSLFLVVGLLVLPVSAGPKLLTPNEVKPSSTENDEAGFEQTIQYNFSPEDRARLRKALSDYSRNSGDHNQIEQKRKAMRDRIEERFSECDKDNDDSLDRVEATQCLPQIARHFGFVDVDEDGVITLEELELAQAKMNERQKAEEAQMEAQRIQEAEDEIKNKSKSKTNKQAATVRKHPS
jgi:Ca2+-binding EF-hand superfamily protein